MMTDRLPRVCVLMSTYNGERFLREQIDSILAQEGVDVTLVVRDDASADSTREILREYASDKKIICHLSGKNVGLGRSFLGLLYKYGKKDEFDYIAFADQDDYWMKDKLAEAVEKIENDGVPRLYASNRNVYCDGENRGLIDKIYPRLTLAQGVSANSIAGCTEVLNRELVKLIVTRPIPTRDVIEFRYHDVWVFCVAAALGKTYYDPNSHMLYRIHGNNVVGGRRYGLKDMLRRMFGYSSHGVIRWNVRSRTARELLRIYPEISGHDREMLERYANYQKGIKNKIAMLRDREIAKASKENRFVFALKILVNFV